MSKEDIIKRIAQDVGLEIIEFQIINSTCYVEREIGKIKNLEITNGFQIELRVNKIIRLTGFMSSIASKYPEYIILSLENPYEDKSIYVIRFLENDLILSVKELINVKEG